MARRESREKGTERAPDTNPAASSAGSGEAPSVSREDEIRMLRRGYEQLRMQLDALRGDYSACTAEQRHELRVQKEAYSESLRQIADLEKDLREARAHTKELKSQNLDLQHHLNAWGIPVSSGTDGVSSLLDMSRTDRFFSPVEPLQNGVDPAPIVLRGDVSVFHLTSVLGFLESSGLSGVLTVLDGGDATKLFIEASMLRMGAWNRRDPELSLSRLLVESELLEPAQMEDYQDENLYDIEVATRLLYERKLDVSTMCACLREHTEVIISQLYQRHSGTFFFQQARPICESGLLFRLSITDLLLRTATHLDEETRDVLTQISGTDFSDLDEYEEQLQI